jgi:MFS family permease
VAPRVRIAAAPRGDVHSDRAARQPRLNLILVALMLGGSVFLLVQSLVIPALPTFQRALGISQPDAAWIFTAPLITAAVATPVAGRMGDMFGNRRVLLAVMTVLTAGTLASALASSLPTLLVARSVSGVGGAIFPLGYGVIRDAFPPARVPAVIGMFSAVLGIGSAIGTVLTGPIIDAVGYHGLFWIPLCAAIAALALAIACVPENGQRAGGPIDVRGIVLLAIWLTILLVAVSKTPTWGVGSARVLLSVAGGAMVFVVWLIGELRTPHPLVDMRVMRMSAIWTTNLVALLLSIGSFGFFVLIPQLAQASTSFGFGLTVTASGFILLPASVAMLLGSAFSSRLAAGVGARTSFTLGPLLLCAALVGTAVVRDHVWQLYAAGVMLGTGYGLAFASLANLIVSAVDSRYTGVTTGMNNVMRMVGGAIGSAIAVTIVSFGAENGANFTVAFGLLSIFAAGAVAASLFAPNAGKARSVPAPPG